jgi:hypothetical protein
MADPGSVQRAADERQPAVTVLPARRVLRIALWVAAVGIALAVAIGAVFGGVVLRQTTVSKPAAADAAAEFARIHDRYKGRAPLIVVKDPGPIMVDVRVNRAPASAPRQHVSRFHVMVWDTRGGTFVRSSAPVWWMHFSGNALLARLGVPLGDLDLTVEDIERYGPGIITDFTPPGGGRMLVWVE